MYYVNIFDHYVAYTNLTKVAKNDIIYTHKLIRNGSTMKQSEKSAITKKKILDAAEKEFSENGFAAARIDNISKESGVNKQLIYSHFGNKEQLYGTVLRHVYERLSEYEDVLSEKEFRGVETVREAILYYFDFLANNPSFVRLVLWENLNGAQYADNIHTGIFTGVRKLLEKGVRAGAIRSDLDIEQTVISMNIFCFSAFSNINTISKLINKNLNSPYELSKRAEHIADVLIRYIFNE